MGAPKLNVRKSGSPPPEVIAALASDIPHRDVAAQLGVTPTAIRWRRRRMFPGRRWTNSRTSRTPRCTCGKRLHDPHIGRVDVQQIMTAVQGFTTGQLHELLLTVDAQLLRREIEASVELARRRVMESQQLRNAGSISDRSW